MSYICSVAEKSELDMLSNFEETECMFRNLFVSFSVLITLTVFVLSLMNGQSVAVNVPGNTQQMPLGVIIFSACVSGSLVPLSLIFFITKRRVSETKKLREWQKQDDKLLKEITSDREKQLEAKITTLEAALKSALKKR